VTTDPKNQKILIFDTAKHHGIGQNLYEEMKKSQVDVSYLDAEKLKKKLFYKIRRSIFKKIRSFSKQKWKYYYYSKLDRSVEKLFCDIQPKIVLFTSYFHKYLDRKLLIKLKKCLGFKLYLIDVDSGFKASSHEAFADYLKYEIQLCDRVFSFSKRISTLMNNMGYKNVQFFPYGAAIVKLESLPKIHDIFFVGTPDIRRHILLEKLKHHNLTVQGKAWGEYKSSLSNELQNKIITENIYGDQLRKKLQQTKIILNINVAAWHTLETGVNLRVFETLALRGFLLTDYCEELNDLFAVGQELEAFKSAEELVDKVSFYLQHDDLREKIARKGHDKFLKYYTWEKRTAELLKSMRNGSNF